MDVKERWIEKCMDNEPWARWCVMASWQDEFSGGVFVESHWPLKREAEAELMRQTLR